MKKKKSPASNQWTNPNAVNNAAARKVGDSLLLGETIRHKTRAGLALGTFLIELPTASTLTALALAGFDFVVLDMEHSSTDFSRLEALIVAAHSVGIAALVRTYGQDTGLIGKALDIGAHGIMAAHVDSPERVREIVAQTRFPPRGRRGFSPLMKFDALTRPLHALDQATYVVVQIEGRQALEHIDEISAVPGIDAVFVGPYDLALSLNVPPGSAQVFEVAQRATKSVPENVALGIYIDDPDMCGAWADRRFALQCVSFDGRMLSDGARSVVSKAQRSMSGPRKSKRVTGPRS